MNSRRRIGPSGAGPTTARNLAPSERQPGINQSDVRVGSWLCENAKTLNRDRRSYSSKTALVAQLASEFNLEVELKNIILTAFRVFEFLHSQGQKATF
jgi:hypothetical protein